MQGVGEILPTPPLKVAAIHNSISTINFPKVEIRRGFCALNLMEKMS